MKPRAILTILAVAGMAVLLFLPADLHAAEPVALDNIGTTCLQSQLDDCKVLTGGFLNVSDYGDNNGAPYLAWQTQFGSTDDDGVIGGFVLFTHDGTDWTLLDSGFDGFFQIPTLNSEGLLHIPGYGQGTASFNTDRLYQGSTDTAVSAGWTRIDMDKWLNDIGPMLPAGLEIWKGVRYDFSNPWAGLTAQTSLWNADDGNCCPTGGSAVITLEVQDNALVATAVAHTPPAKSK